MNKDLPNISYKKGDSTPIVEADNSYYELELYKDGEYFVTIDNFVNFVKSVERIFRSSNQYKKYIAYIKTDVGLSRCQIHGNIEDVVDEDDKFKTSLIEMHHGPILTLFDIVSIVTEDQLAKGKKVTTFGIADLVSEEHFNNNIQVTMLCKTCHELVHTRDIMVHFHQSFGKLESFLIKYKKGISIEMVHKIRKYIDYCEANDYFTNEILSIRKRTNKWLEELEEIYY